jgi:2-polyprenyl-6-methoxyphenol hydroxylase-like FAD-dependent oxidoreductase
MEVTSLGQNTDSVSVLLTNGSRINAKIVVGADGIHSQIRKLAALEGKTQGATTRYSGSSSYRAIARSTNLLSPELDHDAYEIWGKGCRLGFSKINADNYYWYMTFDSGPDKSVSPIARRAHAESLFCKFFPRWISLLESTPPDEILQTDISDLKRLPIWSSARIGLIGDAAHATTPNLGQGGAMAVEDAYSLADAVERSGLNGKAFERYEKQRREKVDWTVATSWNIGRMCHLKNPVLRGLRNAVLRKMLSSGGETVFDRLTFISMAATAPNQAECARKIGTDKS